MFPTWCLPDPAGGFLGVAGVALIAPGFHMPDAPRANPDES